MEEITNSVDEIQLLAWQEIEKIYDESEEYATKLLKKGKMHSDNFWSPYEEDGYDEERVEEVKQLFIDKFPGLEIMSYDDYKYLEIYLQTLDMKQFMYSIKYHYKKKKK